MDPNQTLKEILEDLSEGEIQSAREKMDYLKEWIGKGGFEPNWKHILEEVLWTV